MNIPSLTASSSIKNNFYPPEVLTRTPPNTIADIANPIIQTIYILAGIITLAGLIYGGLMYAMGANQSEAPRIEAGKRALTWSIIGLVILIGIFWIVQLLEIFLGIDILNPGAIINS